MGFLSLCPLDSPPHPPLSVTASQFQLVSACLCSACLCVSESRFLPSVSPALPALLLSLPLASRSRSLSEHPGARGRYGDGGAGDGARLGSRRQLRRGAAARAAPAAGSERARSGSGSGVALAAAAPPRPSPRSRCATRMARAAAPTDGSSGKARRRGAAGRAGEWCSSPPSLPARRPPALPSSLPRSPCPPARAALALPFKKSLKLCILISALCII